MNFEIMKNKSIDSLDLHQAITFKLKESGIQTISDLMYELISDTDIIRIGLTQAEVAEISRIAKTLGLPLEILDESSSDFGISDGLEADSDESAMAAQSTVDTEFYNLTNSPLEELPISKKLYHTLIKNGITSIKHLISFSAEDLSEQKIAGESALFSIRKALLPGKLLLKNDHILHCKHCNTQFVSDDTNQTICADCLAKKRRIAKISKIDIMISGPENYGSYTNLSSGFTLYANIKNTTSDLLAVRLIDFYIVEGDKQISPKYYLSGYSFDEEPIMPNTVRTAGKIWDTARFKYSTSLDEDTYAILTIRVNSEDYKRMYKFVYKNHAWLIDDFYTA